MSQARNVRRRQPWPRAARQTRDRAQESAANNGQALRETLLDLEQLRSNIAAQGGDPELIRQVTEIALSVANAALAFADIHRWMYEAAQADDLSAEDEPPT